MPTHPESHQDRLPISFPKWEAHLDQDTDDRSIQRTTENRKAAQHKDWPEHTLASWDT